MRPRTLIRHPALLPLLVFAALAACLLGTGIGLYRWQYAQTEDEAQRMLLAVADLKSRQIGDWLFERRADAASLAANRLVDTMIGDWLAGGAPQDARHAQLLARLRSFRDLMGYANVLLTDAQGRIVLAAENWPQAENGWLRERVPPLLAQGRTAVSDLHRLDAADRPLLMEVVTPVLAGGGEAQRIVAGLVLLIDPRSYLYPVVQGWPTASASAEALLVRVEGDDIVYLSPLRHDGAEPLGLRRPLAASGLVAAQAARGLRGISRGHDYHDAPVLAAVRAIEDTPWLLIVQIGAEEVFAPLRRTAWLVGLTLCLLLAAAAAVTSVWLWWLRLRERLHAAGLEAEGMRLRSELEFLSNHANDIILLADDEGHVLRANDRAVEAYGHSHDELSGMSLAGLRAQEAPAEAQTLLPGSGTVYETVHLRRDGRRFPVEVSTCSFRVGATRYRQSIIRDITERKVAEALLQRQTQLYALLTATNEAIVRAGDVRALYREVCAAACRSGGFVTAWVGTIAADGQRIEVAASAGSAEVVAFVDRLGLVLDASRPEGRGPTATAIREGRCMLSNEIGEDSPMAFWRPAAEHFGIGSAACFPLRCAGRTVAGISLYAPVPGYFRDDLLHLLEQLAEDLSHALDRFESTVQRQRAELELRRAADLLEAKVSARTAELNDANRALAQRAAESERRAHEAGQLATLSNRLQLADAPASAYTVLADAMPALFPGCPGAFYRLADDGALQALAVWGGLSAQGTVVASGRCRALQDGDLHCHALAAGTTACAALAAGSTGYVCMPVLAQGGTLGLLHLQFDTHDVREHEAVARLARELAERLGLTLANLELRESLRHESLHDPLTGVCNRRYMEDCLRRELARIARDGHVLSVLMVDIDHFKAVNDRWGHEAGDRTLRATARRLGRGTRGGDVICRYGGEEFVVILPGADLSDAARRAEQLRAEAEAGAEAGEETGAQPVTLSIGVASAPLHGRSSDALLGAADRALYQAKSAGRNRVVIAAQPAA